jgi:hypothetical protein
MLAPILFSTLWLLSPKAPAWHIEGTLSEACTCSVPCTCNFGEAPAPFHFCYAVIAMNIEKGDFNGTDISGLKLGGANGAKGYVFYIDDKASPAQESALKAISNEMIAKAWAANGLKDPKKVPAEFKLIGFQRAKITQEISPKANNIKLGDSGGFQTNYIIGIDGKTPLRVANNYTFNFKDPGIKGKTRFLKYKDKFGNSLDYNGTNANQGRFDWTDQTAIYFR